MKGEWCYFKSYLSKEQCEEIIRTAKTMPGEDAVIGSNGKLEVVDSFRRSKVRFIQKGDWRFQKIYDILWKTAIEANNDFFNIHITKLSFFQIAEYDASYQGEYKLHHDVFWLNDTEYHRKLSCVVQLSDPADYSGGDFELHDVMHPPTPEELKDQGTIIFFPSFFRHLAKPVIRGTRYSIAAWFEGPKWR